MSGLLSWRGWWRVSEDLVDRLRLVNPYSGSQVLAVCRDAADEIERLRAEMQEVWAAADRLATQLETISSGNTDVLREYDMRRDEARHEPT